MIEVLNVDKNFYTKDVLLVLKNISLSIKRNEIVSILGPSGCGKSTLLNIIAGILRQDNGKIIGIEGGHHRIGYVFQNDIILPWRNVYRNITLGLELNQSIDMDSNRVDSLLNIFELSEFKYYMPIQLSGGMKQKVAFVRTILPEPNILLLDEPFSNLDFRTKIEVEEYLLKYVKKMPNRCCIFVTHNIDEAVSISDKIVFLSKKPTRVIKEKVIDTNSRESLLKFRLSTKYEKLYTEIAEIINDVYENKYI
jgi:NitT/TauT family transport system ATP-binding protein